MPSSPTAHGRFASSEPALFLLQVMDGRGVWRTRKRLGCVVAAVSEVAGAASAYAGGRLRLVEVGREPATGAPVHREVLRAGGDAGGSRIEAPGDRDARALVSALRRCGEWAGRRPLRGGEHGRGRRALRGVAAIAVLSALGAVLLSDARWGAPPGQGPSAIASIAAAAGSVLESVRPSIEIIGAALAREIAPERATYPAPHISLGVSWRETLDGAMRGGMTCREADPAHVACELGRGVWLRDAQSAQLLFDRRDGHLAAVLVVSRLLVDRQPGKDGREIKRRFAEIKGTIDRLLPPGYTVSVRSDAGAGVAFWSGLRAADGQGAYAAYWTADGDAAGLTVSLRLYGIDADRGFYKLLVERPS